MRRVAVILSSGAAFVIFLLAVAYHETLNWIDREKAREM